jgi:phosphopantothenoylcysteine decarboxylase / phosphopantothenate---cysteine ligase
LDDVRYFANGSSGRMGYALAAAALAAGHGVVLVSGPTALTPPPGAEVRAVTSALEMAASVTEALGSGEIDVVLAVAAVADYRPAVRAPGKLPSGEPGFTVEFLPNPDILGDLGARRRRGELDAVLVGFALQSGDADEILDLGRHKLQRKHLDMIVVNHSSAMGAVDNEVTLVYAAGRSVALPRRAKTDLAPEIVAAAVQILADRKSDNQGGSKA